MLASWQTDSGLDLGVSLDDSERELSRAFAMAEADDMHASQSLLLFTNATEIIAAAATPLDAESIVSVEQLLAKSRELARVASGQTPSAVSPSNTLKSLRKHQADPGLYDFGGEKK